jgi:hypothetical protein
MFEILYGHILTMQECWLTIVPLSLMRGDYKAASHIMLLLQIVAAYVFWPVSYCSLYDWPDPTLPCLRLYMPWLTD